jgi:alkylated DNA repair protein (DNA oxidative demethylase)
MVPFMNRSMYNAYMNLDLFEDSARAIEIAPGAYLFKKFVKDDRALLDALDGIAERSPFRHMVTARGFRMSVAMTSCGEAGWVSDRTGYRYDPVDPQMNQPWPPMPPVFFALARQAAAEAGYPSFVPDACLINRYETGAKLSLHQDKDEKDMSAPVVSVSLGVPATFIFGGLERESPKRKFTLQHGDVVVWGGPSRLVYHGILPLKAGLHPLLGNIRINLTFRKTK